MQSVSAAFTAEEKDRVRNVTADMLISWKKFSTLGNRTFTIGVSVIGGPDIIGINPGAIGSPGNYQYFNETDYLTYLAWERGLKMPVGGLSKGFAEAELENTTERFTPRYMGGSSELFTAILPRRPFIVNAGFEVAGVPQNIPQFSGIFTRQPEVDRRDRRVRVVGSDYVDFFENRYLDQEIMFTGQRSDMVYEDLLQSLGLSTSQYRLDTGINVIPFGRFEKGTTYSYIFDKLAEAENGYFYQDEEGIFRFENRYHWDDTDVDRIVLTGQVIDAIAPDESHIINVVEIKSELMSKQQEQIIFRLNPFDFIELAASTATEVFVEFEDSALSMTTPTSTGTESYFVANTLDDGSGTNVTSSISVTKVYKFANAAKIEFTNTTAQIAYITNLVITGRPAKKTGDLYTRAQDSSSLTAFEERNILIENPFIQDQIWAESLAQMLVSQYSEPDSLQRITIRAMPSLQLGDLVSWQGRYWRIFDIKSILSPTNGFTQELTMLQRQLVAYFRIGISTIGGTDKIAP